MRSRLRIQQHNIHKSLQKSLHWKKLKNTRRTKGGVREKGRKGKTHTICVMSRNAGDSLAPSNSTAPPIVSSQSIIQTDCSREPPPKKIRRPKQNALQFFSHHTRFLRRRFTSEASFRNRTCSWRACGILWPPSPGETFFTGKKTVML